MAQNVRWKNDTDLTVAQASRGFMHVAAQRFVFAKRTAHRWHTANTLRRRQTRIRLFERLETRQLLATAEGTPFPLNESLDASELAGGLSASIDWGDGTVTSGDVSAAGGGSLVAHVDYSLDTHNFFDTQPKKDLFQLAVDTVLSHLGDDLAAIVPNGRNTWTAEFSHPGTGATHSITNLQVARNEIVIYAGGRDLGETIGVGGPGGFRVSCADPSFCDVVATRGEPGARVQAGGPPPTDFGPWGGSVTFDTDTDFYFSPSLAGVGTQQSDFLSVAMHEIAHLLGFGTAGAWTTYASGGVFNGPASKAANGNQSVPLSSDGGHWKAGTMSNGQNVALDPSLTNGTRRLLTALDFAGLDDVGWNLVPSWHNSAQPLDVNGDLKVSPIDVLQIVNDLNLQGSRQLPMPKLTDVPPYLDVNNDGFTSPLDALLVVNFLNQGLTKSEGEASGEIVRHKQHLAPVAIASTPVSAVDNHRRPRPSRPDSKRELVYFTDRFEDTLADDLITDIVVANNRRADF